MYCIMPKLELSLRAMEAAHKRKRPTIAQLAQASGVDQKKLKNLFQGFSKSTANDLGDMCFALTTWFYGSFGNETKIAAAKAAFRVQAKMYKAYIYPYLPYLNKKIRA